MPSVSQEQGPYCDCDIHGISAKYREDENV